MGMKYNPTYYRTSICNIYIVIWYGLKVSRKKYFDTYIINQKDAKYATIQRDDNKS